MENGGGSDPGVGLEPGAVEEADFATVRRGYEPEPVRARLREAAAEIRRLNTLVGSLSHRIAELEDTPAEVLESRRVAEALGDEATRILQSASDAAQERIERAETEHARIVGEAQATAAAAIEDGREQGRNILQEARNIRERILADLAGKRREYQIEVEQLREMHDRLTEALGIFRQGLDGWIEELVQAGPRAAAAAERAGLRAAARPESTVAQIEAEIATARLAGTPLDGGPAEEAPAGLAGTHLDGEPATEASAGDETPAPADTSTGAGEPDSPEDGDEPEAGDESVEIAGLTLEASPKPPGAPARLYDVEAEADVAFDAGAGLHHEQAPDAGADPSGTVSSEAGPDTGAPPASDAEAIFARLRSITAQPVTASPEPTSTEPGATDDAVLPVPGGVAGEPAGFADEFDEEFAVEHTAAVEPSDPDDLVGAARAVAVGGDCPQAQAAGRGRAGRSARRHSPQRDPSRALHHRRRHQGLHPRRARAHAGLRVRHRREHRRHRSHRGRRGHRVRSGRAGPDPPQRFDRGDRRRRRAEQRRAFDLPGVPIAPG
ncbi:MAG: hypothetical protein F4X38_02305 [Acidimicrobiaceae bacterium]|nr:hypothetical protein [Acidimicrobiaceae bacterium]